MSFEALVQIQTKARAKRIAQHLLYILADHYNGKTGQCNVGQRTLAREAGYSQPRMNTWLNHLREIGDIDWQEARRGQSRRYQLLYMDREVSTGKTHFGDTKSGKVSTERTHSQPDPDSEVSTDRTQGEYREDSLVSTEGNQNQDQEVNQESSAQARPSSSETTRSVPLEERVERARQKIQKHVDELAYFPERQKLFRDLLDHLDNVPDDPEEQKRFWARLTYDFEQLTGGVKPETRELLRQLEIAKVK